ncbi:MAG TPA: PEP-CTERM sorting domain-containing protein [Nitrospiraceae bacterium]|nr:PEP-CTERM sorting domain-containing protein [Nitrospiraceae bacterium]
MIPRITNSVPAVVSMCLLYVLLPSYAHADTIPVTITAGSVSAGEHTDFRPVYGQPITGNGFSWCCPLAILETSVSVAGATTTLGGTFQPMVSDSVTLNGAVYQPLLDQSISFTTPSVQLPPLPCGPTPFDCPGPPTTSLSAPFTMAGDLLLRNAATHQQVEVGLVGQGTVTATFTEFPSGPWNLEGFNITFGPAGAAVPEPASWLLAGTGVLGLGILRKRTKKL